MAFGASDLTTGALLRHCQLAPRKADRMVPKFADYWKKQAGCYPARLLFDSRATTYAGLSELTQHRIGFTTIRRRGSGMFAPVERCPWTVGSIARLPRPRVSVARFNTSMNWSSSTTTKVLCGN